MAILNTRRGKTVQLFRCSKCENMDRRENKEG